MMYFSLLVILCVKCIFQPYEFVIQSDGEASENKKLVVALACDTYPLLQVQNFYCPKLGAVEFFKVQDTDL